MFEQLYNFKILLKVSKGFIIVRKVLPVDIKGVTIVRFFYNCNKCFYKCFKIVDFFTIFRNILHLKEKIV